MINHRSDLSDLYYILFCFQPRQKLRHAKTLKLGETSDGEDDVDNWEGPRLTRSQQREMRNSQARGRGAKGQGRGRGRKSKKEKEVEDIPSDGNEETGNEEQVEDLPEETKEAKKPGKGPKAKASPRKKMPPGQRQRQRHPPKQRPRLRLSPSDEAGQRPNRFWKRVVPVPVNLLFRWQKARNPKGRQGNQQQNVPQRNSRISRPNQFHLKKDLL